LVLLLVCCFSAVYSECSRCRAFDLTISCEEQASLVKRKYNGYMCAAKAGANVVLNCTLDDIDGLAVEYEWWKSNTVEGKDFGSQMSGSKQIANCTTASCQLTDVQWSESEDVGEHDSQFYQCVAKVTLNSNEHVFYSNAIKVDVQAYIAAGEATIGSESVDIRTTETKLACTVPTTNPASEVVWKYMSSNGSSEQDAESMSNVLVVRDTIVANDAKYGYSVGMLVLMDFKASDAGTYKCLVKYTDQWGNVNQAVKSTYNVASTGITKSSVSEQLILVSHVTGPAFLYHDTDATKLQCLASNLDAGESAKHYWQKSEVIDGLTVYRNVSSNFTMTHQNRTLLLSKNYDYTDTQFRCQVQKGSSQLLRNGFIQSPILPKTTFVPTGMSCKTNGSSYEATINSLMSDDVEGSGQVLAGSSYYWHRNGDSISKFTEGYSVASSKLGYTISESKQCDYVQQHKYYGGVYSVQQIHSLSVFDSLSEVVPTISQIKTSGSDLKTITCIGAVSGFGTTLNNKIGVSIMLDVSGCTEYMHAVTAWSEVKGTCETSTSRWVTIDRSKLCSNCVIKCYAATACKESQMSAVTVEPKTTCDGDTSAVTSDMPGWGVALIVVVVIIGLFGISAIFFYTYMEKIQANSDSKIVGAAVLKVNNFVGKKPEPEEPTPMFTMPSMPDIGNIFKLEDVEEPKKERWWKRWNPFKRSAKVAEPDI